MTIERHAGKQHLVCDSCGQGFTPSAGKRRTYAHDEFDVMLSDAKEEGWIITRESDGKWVHYCMDCVG